MKVKLLALGGTGGDDGYGIAVDAAGSAYVTGATTSLDFPTVNPLQAVKGGDMAAFVAKLTPGGSALVYATYLGGSVAEEGYDIAVDATGNAYVTGFTASPDFPTVRALQATLGGGGAGAFVTKLSPDGSVLMYSTYLGGSGDDFAIRIAVDAAGDACVTGSTSSLDFPVAQALQAAYGGGARDGFVAKLTADGSALVYATYPGGSGDDAGNGANAFVRVAVAVDAAGNPSVTGRTDSPNFPTVNALQPVHSGGVDAFVAKLTPDGSALVYSTYLGGSGVAWGNASAVDVAGNVYVTGVADSPNFPIFNPLQEYRPGAAFVAGLTADGSTLVFSTYLGGDPSFLASGYRDVGRGIAVDPAGNVYVIGKTLSPSFPTANALQPVLGEVISVFVTKISP